MTKLFLIAALMTLSLAVFANGPASNAQQLQDANAAEVDPGTTCGVSGNQGGIGQPEAGGPSQQGAAAEEVLEM
jgi:hypothetical protein